MVMHTVLFHSDCSMVGTCTFQCARVKKGMLSLQYIHGLKSDYLSKWSRTSCLRMSNFKRRCPTHGIWHLVHSNLDSLC